jgi:serine/threonine protein kinase
MHAPGPAAGCATIRQSMLICTLALAGNLARALKDNLFYVEDKNTFKYAAFNLGLAYQMSKSLVSTMAALHALGVIHCDGKPEV